MKNRPRPNWIDPRGIGDAQLVRSHRQGLREAKRCGLRRGVEREPGRQRRRADDSGFADLQVERVEHQLVGRFAHVDVDGHDSGERGGIEVGRQIDRVVKRYDGLGQKSGRRGEGVAAPAAPSAAHRRER